MGCIHSPGWRSFTPGEAPLLLCHLRAEDMASSKGSCHRRGGPAAPGLTLDSSPLVGSAANRKERDCRGWGRFGYPLRCFLWRMLRRFFVIRGIFFFWYVSISQKLVSLNHSLEVWVGRLFRSGLQYREQNC